MNESEDDDLIPTPLFCTSCKKNHSIALRANAILRKELATLVCPACQDIGVLCLARIKSDDREPTGKAQR